MRNDRYVKLVLTVIAVALCTIALPRLEIPEVVAAPRMPESIVAVEPQQGATPQRAERLAESSDGPRAPASTKPLRWRIPLAGAAGVLFDAAVCTTAVQVTALQTTGSVAVDVEALHASGLSLGLGTLSVAAGGMRLWMTVNNLNINPEFGWVDTVIGTGNFMGYALVNSNDPRIMVNAALVCNDNGDRRVTPLPAYPVGATAEFFLAGMPPSWTPPAAVSEAPE